MWERLAAYVEELVRSLSFVRGRSQSVLSDSEVKQVGDMQWGRTIKKLQSGIHIWNALLCPTRATCT